MIKRDFFSIICQHDPANPEYLDGGDSARATGMMAMAGSTGDQAFLEQFEVKDGYLCRHPYQDLLKDETGKVIRGDFSNPNNFTRDQLVQFFGGLNKATQQNTLGLRAIALARRVFWAHARRLFFCQNSHDLEGNQKVWWKSRDPLPPSNIGQMILTAKLWPLYIFLPFTTLWLLIDIFFSAKFAQLEENNQIIALCDVYGVWALKLYCYLNPKWREGLIIYWGIDEQFFRHQREIAQELISYIENKI
jgi:hypothetical protein